MKSSQTTKLLFKVYLFISFVLQIKGSLLSRMKNRYEYLPLPIKEYTNEEYVIDETSPEFRKSNATIASDVDTPKFAQHESSLKTIVTNASNFYIDIMRTQEPHVQKRLISSETESYYYDQDKWYAIKLFVALTSTARQSTQATEPTHGKRTWPPYFPPKFVSKLQSELDYALLPWKATTPKWNEIYSIREETSTPKKNIANVKAFCYMCGLNESGIPRMPGCYQVFDSPDQRDRIKIRRMKIKCIDSKEKKIVKNKYYGPDYIGGCFKRFLDVGIEYNERGCRTKEPTKGMSYASRRLAYLERMLKDTDNGCVFSPYASLTPFSRAISLYARYHVCVCDTKYCNGGSYIFPPSFYKLLSLTLYILI